MDFGTLAMGSGGVDQSQILFCFIFYPLFYVFNTDYIQAIYSYLIAEFSFRNNDNSTNVLLKHNKLSQL